MGLRAPSSRATFTIVTLALGTAWSTLLADWHLNGRASVLDRIEAPLVDLRFLIAGPRQAPPEVVIVALDDATVREAGASPLPRPVMARLVREIAAHGPKGIALDILFLDPSSAEADQGLADACGDARAVVAAAGVFSPERERRRSAKEALFGRAPVVDRVLWPIDPIAASAGVGLVNVATDHGGTARHVPLVFRIEDRILPSLPLRLVIGASGDPELQGESVKIGHVVTPADLGFHLPLRFYGPRGTITTLSAGDVLRGTVVDNALRSRFVLVGATALGASDSFATPFDRVLPGVEVLATAVSHLVTGDGLLRSAAVRRIDATAIVTLPVVAVLLIGSQRVGVGLLLVALLLLVWTGVAILAFTHGVWLSIAMPLGAALPTAIIYISGRLWLEHRLEQRLTAVQQVFRRFHPPALADRLSARPDFLDHPVQQNAAVLFVDLTGFTGLSERIGPSQTRELLRQFHTIIEDEVNREGGLVVDYMGDGAMVVFGILEEREDDAFRAVETAIALADQVRTWLGEVRVTSGEVGVKIGAHYGPVVISRLGARDHQQIAATGDCVNVASRLLEVAATRCAILALSTELFEAASRHSCARYAASSLTEEHQISIRGRRKTVGVRFWGVVHE